MKHKLKLYIFFFLLFFVCFLALGTINAETAIIETEMELINALNDGYNNILLNNDIALSSILVIDRGVTINLNNKNITEYGLRITESNVTIKNGGIKPAAGQGHSSAPNAAIIIHNGGSEINNILLESITVEYFTEDEPIVYGVVPGPGVKNLIINNCNIIITNSGGHVPEYRSVGVIFKTGTATITNTTFIGTNGIILETGSKKGVISGNYFNNSNVGILISSLDIVSLDEVFDLLKINEFSEELKLNGNAKIRVNGVDYFSKTESNFIEYPWPPTGGGWDYHILTLEPGWNVVSTPRVLLSHEFSAPGTVDNFDIYVLDPTAPSGWNTMQGMGQDEFTPLYAYFVNNKTGENQTLRINYDFNLTPAQRLFQRTLHPGWNMVGIALPEEDLHWGRENKDSWHVQEILNLANESMITWVDFTANQGNINSLKVSDKWDFRSNLDSSHFDILSNFKGYGVFVKEKTSNYIGFQNLTDFSVKEINVTSEDGRTTLPERQNLQMVAEVLPYYASDKTMTWSIINKTGEAEINQEGLLKGIKEGLVKVRATANDGSGATGELEISIIGPAPSGEIELSINPNTPKTGVFLGSKDATTPGQELIRFDIIARNQNITVEEIDVVLVDGSGAIAYLKLYDGETLLATKIAEGSGTVIFDNLEIKITEDITKTLRVTADLTKITSAKEHAKVRATINTVAGYDNEGTNITCTESITGNHQYIYSAVPEITRTAHNITASTDRTTANGYVEFKAKAVGGRIRVSSTSSITVADYGANASTSMGAIDVTPSGTTGGYYVIEEGQERTFNVPVFFSNATGSMWVRVAIETFVWQVENPDGLWNEIAWDGDFVQELRSNQINITN